MTKKDQNLPISGSSLNQKMSHTESSISIDVPTSLLYTACGGCLFIEMGASDQSLHVWPRTSLSVLSGCHRIHSTGWIRSRGCYIRLYQNRPALASGYWPHLWCVWYWADLDSFRVKSWKMHRVAVPSGKPTNTETTMISFLNTTNANLDFCRTSDPI